MNTHLVATVATFAAIVAQPVSAITFPTLTTIYVGAGVTDDGGALNNGIATSFLCSNVSSVTAGIRYLVLSSIGAVVASASFNVAHGTTTTVSTHNTLTFIEQFNLETGPVSQGAINIEATQSGVFCTAAVVNAAVAGEGISLHLVRVNPHPGTVE